MADTSKDNKWRTVRYVRHREICTYLCMGWVLVDDLQGTHHGHHAVIMELVRE